MARSDSGNSPSFRAAAQWHMLDTWSNLANGLTLRIFPLVK
jgi:hypothetical protein